MGRNAKFLKKVKKTGAAQRGSSAATGPTPATPAAEQKRKAGLRGKTHKRKEGSEGHVLGGADYVELLMGSRRKAKQEAAKLPRDSDE